MRDLSYNFNPQDEYAYVTINQNNGIHCPYCYSKIGHYNVCPLISGPSSESPSLPENELKTVETYRPKDFSNLTISEGDSIRLLGMGVLWDSIESGPCFHPIC